MADRYWVGGTGSWDTTTTTNWSASSGGSGGASVPTSADDVFFDASSGAGTVTVTATGNCLSLNFTGYTGTFAGSNSVNVNGNLTLASGMTWTHISTITFPANSGSYTITSNGRSITSLLSFGPSAVSTATWALQDAFSSNTTITLTSGTFTTNGYAVTASQLSSSNSNVRTINLGSSTVTLNGSTPLNFSTSTNLTFNAGTSSITISGSSVTFNGGGVTFYNVSFTGSFLSSCSITGSNTFNNLLLTAGAYFSNNCVSFYNFSSGQTINGTLSTVGGSGRQKTSIQSATVGIAYTFTINGTTSLSDVNFRDIYVVGTSAPIFGTRVGNLGGTSGITFSTPKTVYWNLLVGGSWTENAWATTAGGTVNLDNVPLPQDTAVFVNTGLNTSATVTLDGALRYASSIDMSGRTNAMTLFLNQATSVYGDWKNGSGTTISGSATLTFAGRNTQTITSAGKTFTAAITIDSIGGTVQLADALNIGSNLLVITNGTFTTNGYAVTAGSLSSTNSNVRTINLGASTVTTNSVGNFVDFSTSTNLTFNAGTSTITNSTALGSIAGGGQTFYNVSFLGSAFGYTNTISGANTFNNLTFVGPSSTGIGTKSLSANQIVNGTLTVTDTAAVRRIFFQSNTQGTARTLTVNSLSATDCDFRDITLAGAAAGSSPTRAGDCGGNTGITFPAAKTVYWNLAGTQNWSATAWATSSGGTPDVNNFPLPQDTAVFDNTGSAGTVTFNTSWNIGTFDASARTSAMNLAWSTNSPACYGNWTSGTGLTFSSAGGRLNFAKRGTQTLTSNGITFPTNLGISIVSFNGTLQLADALNTYDLNVSSGTFDAVSYNVTLFSASLSGTVRMGSGTWTLTYYGTIWSASGATIYCGTANIVLSDNTTNARTFNGSGKVYNKLTIGGNTSTSTTTFSSSDTFSELASTKTVAHTINISTGITPTYGAWTVTGTAGNVVTVSGQGTINIAGARVSGVDYLSISASVQASATSPGEFYVGANSTGGLANFIFTAAPTPVTRYWVGGTGTWNTTNTTNWSDTSGGLGGFSVPTSADAVIFDSLSNATAYTVTCSATRCGALTFSAPLTGNVTWAGFAALVVHGNFTLPATGLTRSFTGNLTFSGSSTGKTITTNGVSLGSSIDINGIGCGWTLGSAFSASGTFTVSQGSFDTAGYALSTSGGNAFSSNTDGLRTISFGASTVTFISYAFRNTNLTFNKGTSTVVSSSSGSNFGITNTSANDLGSLEFYNITFSNTIVARSLTISGNITANTLTVAAASASGNGSLSFTGNQTYNTLTLQTPADATRRTALISSVAGTTQTLTLGAFTATSDYDFRDIAVTGAAAPISGTRFGNLKGNSGITFDAAKTVYWNLAGNQSWTATAWASSSGGTPSINNYPLAQDTAVFNNTGAVTGTISLVDATNIGTIDMSTRTSAMSLAANAMNVYGNWITGTGVTYGGSSAITFLGRTSQTFTSAGKTITFGITINSIGGSFTLQDALTSNYDLNAVILTNGTFNLNGYSVLFSNASSAFSSSNSNVRTLAFGSGGTFTLAGSGTSWNISSSTTTGFTVTGTGTISLTNNSLAKSFFAGGVSYSGITLNQGGAGLLGIYANNTFYDITNTYSATGATSINIFNTTQTLTQFTASGAAGRVLSIIGNSASSPGTLIVPSSNKVKVDYLSISNVRAYPVSDIWYVGDNSVNLGSYGFVFSVFKITAAITGVLASGFVGTAIASFQQAISSVAGAGDVGSLSVESYPALLSALAKGQVDVFVPSNTVSATGVVASGVLGTATGEALYLQAITGSGSAGNIGSVALGTRSLGISGIEASGVTDVVTTSRTRAITGNAASATIGDLAASLLSALSSASADGLLGALASNRSVAIVGVPASAIPGTMTGEALYYKAITGTVSTGAVGSVTLGSRLVPITGNAASGNIGIVWCWTPIDDTQNPNWTLIPTTSP